MTKDNFSRQCFKKLNRTLIKGKSKARDQLIQARKTLFCHVIVNKHLIKRTWRRKIKEQTSQLALLYCGRTVRSRYRRCSNWVFFFFKLKVYMPQHRCYSVNIAKSLRLPFPKISANRCLKIGVLKNLTNFTGKHLGQSLFANKFAGLRPFLMSALWLFQGFTVKLA